MLLVGHAGLEAGAERQADPGKGGRRQGKANREGVSVETQELLTEPKDLQPTPYENQIEIQVGTKQGWITRGWNHTPEPQTCYEFWRKSASAVVILQFHDVQLPQDGPWQYSNVLLACQFEHSFFFLLAARAPSSWTTCSSISAST